MKKPLHKYIVDIQAQVEAIENCTDTDMWKIKQLVYLNDDVFLYISQYCDLTDNDLNIYEALMINALDKLK